MCHLGLTPVQLKEKYARNLIRDWKESTDPVKHVFEDLGIAAFLIELWATMYGGETFPGFVDIGCGNGLLVYILNKEGYVGWGFDARSRKSWQTYNSTDVLLPETLSPNGDGAEKKTQSMDTLRQMVLIPDCLPEEVALSDDNGEVTEDRIHNGVFPTGTFIISNHSDELTPWTPILAAQSDSPFIMIPCCSHDLSGARYRAPAPKKTKGEPSSTYTSLVSWVSDIASDCGWEVEKEMLRIPSTRNAAIIGRRRTADSKTANSEHVIQKYGGATGYRDSAMKLLKTAILGH
jgi:tRNASer (uridine44-2'-O)-methyltransferase